MVMGRGRGFFAGLCADARTVCEGAESEEVVSMRALQAAPSAFDNWAATKKWKSGVEDVPNKLSDEEFEKWLWRVDA